MDDQNSLIQNQLQNQQVTAIVSVLQNLVTAVNELTLSLAQSKLNDAIGTYAYRVDDAGAGVIYYGYATPGTADSAEAWSIKKQTTTVADIIVLWADGNLSYDNVWNDRTSLTYS